MNYTFLKIASIYLKWTEKLFIFIYLKFKLLDF